MKKDKLEGPLPKPEDMAKPVEVPHYQVTFKTDEGEATTLFVPQKAGRLILTMVNELLNKNNIVSYVIYGDETTTIVP